MKKTIIVTVLLFVFLFVEMFCGEIKQNQMNTIEMIEKCCFENNNDLQKSCTREVFQKCKESITPKVVDGINVLNNPPLGTDEEE